MQGGSHTQWRARASGAGAGVIIIDFTNCFLTLPSQWVRGILQRVTIDPKVKL